MVAAKVEGWIPCDLLEDHSSRRTFSGDSLSGEGHYGVKTNKRISCRDLDKSVGGIPQRDKAIS